MSYWTANGFIMGASQGVGEDGRIDTRSPSASTSPALVRHTNTCVPSSSRHHTTSTSASVYHPDAAAAQPILATLPPWDHIPLHAQSISHQGAVSPLSSDYRSLSPSMYDEAYLQALIAPYQAVSSEPTGHYREPSDLNGIINEKELRLMKRCGGGGYGDVYSLRHILLGDIALKRIREAGNDDVVAQGREVSTCLEHVIKLIIEFFNTLACPKGSQDLVWPETSTRRRILRNLRHPNSLLLRFSVCQKRDCNGLHRTPP